MGRLSEQAPKTSDDLLPKLIEQSTEYVAFRARITRSGGRDVFNKQSGEYHYEGLDGNLNREFRRIELQTDFLISTYVGRLTTERLSETIPNPPQVEVILPTVEQTETYGTPITDEQYIQEYYDQA